MERSLRLNNGSGVSREVHALFCEGLAGKFRRSTLHTNCKNPRYDETVLSKREKIRLKYFIFPKKHSIRCRSLYMCLSYDNDSCIVNIMNQIFSLCNVISLASRKNEIKWIAKTINECVDFCRKSTTTSSKSFLGSNRHWQPLLATNQIASINNRVSFSTKTDV